MSGVKEPAGISEGVKINNKEPNHLKFLMLKEVF